MSFAHPTLCRVEIATGALNLAPRSGLAGVIDDKGALASRTHLILVEDPPSQLAGQSPPMDVLAAQEIIKHAHLARQNLTEFGAEAVQRFNFQQRPDPQRTQQIGQRFSIGAAFAAHGGAEPPNQRVTLDAFGQFGIDEGQGLVERIGQGGVGTGAAALAGFRGLRFGRGDFNSGASQMTVYRPLY